MALFAAPCTSPYHARIRGTEGGAADSSVARAGPENLHLEGTTLQLLALLVEADKSIDERRDRLVVLIAPR